MYRNKFIISKKEINEQLIILSRRVPIKPNFRMSVNDVENWLSLNRTPESVQIIKVPVAKRILLQ
jgi:hypothetical protein